MKQWPHVEVIHPQEKLGGYWPRRKRPSSLAELRDAARLARQQGSAAVLKAEYARGYRPTGPRRLVLRGVPGTVVGSVRAGDTAWTFVAVAPDALSRYVRARARTRSAPRWPHDFNQVVRTRGTPKEATCQS